MNKPIFKAEQAEQYEGVYRAKYPKQKPGPAKQELREALIAYIKEVGVHSYAESLLAAHREALEAVLAERIKQVMDKEQQRGTLSDEEKKAIQQEEVARAQGSTRPPSGSHP